MLCDAHVHFFSPRFFATLAGQRQVATVDAIRHLGWDDPGSVEALADRWVAELDAQGVSRAAIIASVPGDEDSVAGAVARHPSRLTGYFMLDPTREDAEDRVMRALARGVRGVCLFPAMQRYSLHDERVTRVAEILAAFSAPSAGGDLPSAATMVESGPLARGVALPGDTPAVDDDLLAPSSARPVLFVHCGVLSVGARGKMGLPSPFDVSKGNPLDLHTLALRFPTLPIVIPHFGAGMFREALMLADLCPNVHLDTSSSNRWIRYTPGLTLEQVFEAALDVVGAERVLFGTDSSFFPRGWHRAVYNQQRTALVSLGVPETKQSLIFGGNFARLFGAASD
jgi:predicted TIM-barrel fold metal-dependent hydrolase